MRKGGSGAPKLSQNHGTYEVFAASEKTKIEDKDSGKKHCILRGFWPVSLSGAKTRVQKSA